LTPSRTPPRRLAWIRDIVDAYVAGARELDVHEVFDEVEDYLRRISTVQHHELATAS